MWHFFTKRAYALWAYGGAALIVASLWYPGAGKRKD